jgi:hypothetical protein
MNKSHLGGFWDTGIFQAGQNGRTIVPPISLTFPSQFPTLGTNIAPHRPASYTFPPAGQATRLKSAHIGLPSSTDHNIPRRVGVYSDSPYTGKPAAKSTKRKRANAARLEFLNETYKRTAFPSTDERAELARKLDMTTRAVQIW